MSTQSATDQADAALVLEELDDEELDELDDDELDDDPDVLEPESLLVLEELSLLAESPLLPELSEEVLLDPLPRLSVR